MISGSPGYHFSRQDGVELVAGNLKQRLDTTARCTACKYRLAGVILIALMVVGHNGNCRLQISQEHSGRNQKQVGWIASIASKDLETARDLDLAA
jgi:hypothetical protein